ncbi:MAG TPA: hypothetical protein P5132_00750 [Bacteroidales bacterium]|nr:hypothetical protein [Bacteroidales bacterium]
MKNIILFLIIIFYFSNCKNENKDLKNIEYANNKTLNKIFYFPDTLEILNKDSVITYETYNLLYGNIKRPKIVTFIWGDCHVCISKIEKWDSIISKNILGDSLSYILVISTSDKDYFLRNFYREYNNIDKMIIDTNDIFFKLNDINNNPENNTFLLDKNNIIKFTGNPVVYDKLIDSYRKVLLKL